MNGKDMERLEMLLDDAFGPNGRKDAASAPLGFTTRVMARVAESQARRENTLAAMLLKVARPLLVSGWVTVAALALLVFSNLAQSRTDTLALLLSGDVWVRYIVS